MKKHKSKIKVRKTRQIFQQNFQEFVGKDDDYGQWMTKIICHKKM